MNVPFVRTPYNYDVDEASEESGLFCADPSLAVQDGRDEADINTIVRRFGLTGELPQGLRIPEYGDFVGITDYHSAMNAVAQANETFELLPAELRARFENDPEQFVSFCLDAKNGDELVKLGLAVPNPAEKPEPAPAPVEPVKP